MTTDDKMICPKCGAEMNHHSDKLVYTTDSQSVRMGEMLGSGYLEEFHACPKCGSVASRHAA